MKDLTSSIISSTMIAIRPPTSPTTLIGGLAFPTKGGNVAPTDVTLMGGEKGQKQITQAFLVD